MRPKARSYIVLILSLFSLSIIFLYGCTSPGGGTAGGQDIMSALKKINSLTPYEEVVKMLGEPQIIHNEIRSKSGEMIQTKEWDKDKGRIEIVFVKKNATSRPYVRQIKYINVNGEIEYSYKLLYD